MIRVCWGCKMKENLKELVTPCGVMTIVDKNSNCIPFTVRKNLFDCPYSFKNAQGETVTLRTDTNYEIVIKTSDLEKGVTYQLFLKGAQLEYGDSDEHTECISGCSNGHCIAIGTWLPNDNEKLQQAEEYSEKMGFLKYNSIIEPPQYDTSRFKEYDVEMSDDCSGYSFYLIDDTISEIFFSVAWIKSNGVDNLEYESAVQYWTI